MPGGNRVSKHPAPQAPIEVDGDDFELQPRRPRYVPDSTFRAYVTLRRAIRTARGAQSGVRVRGSWQSCTVKVKYVRNFPQNQWRGIGAYMIRTDKTQCEKEEAGFDQDGIRYDIPGVRHGIPQTLHRWQKERDPRIYTIIVSPEPGSKADITALTRDLMAQVERDLGRPLEWVASVHNDRDHQHAHVALRSRDRNGYVFRFEPDYIRFRFRSIARQILTQQLGYRMEPLAPEPLRRRYGLIELPAAGNETRRLSENQRVPDPWA
jgi:hypothetical protein